MQTPPPPKTVLFTSSGDEVSANVALTLANRGCRLVLVGEEDRMKALRGRIAGSLSGGVDRVPLVEVVGLDMEEESEGVFEEAVTKACGFFQGLDALVHCYTYEGKLQEPLQMSEEEFKKTVRINFMSPWYLLKAVSKRLQQNESGGSVVLLNSFIGSERVLYPGSAVYGSCLAGVQQLARTSALELGKYKIRVNAIARGLHLDDGFPRAVGQDRAQKLVRDATPLHRWLDVERDLASTVIYLISDGARYMTGTTIYVDGGQSLVRPRMRSYM
ncbi:hypothetical protein MLD38_022611 [Melastoma candidum]|uniref:Uncharacterized protein n=1 Tax=Melastoma candidum TaxID=119954 RepID=A0ACB9QN77_9MYRT|nr:hypothetical protein MLD38_022611 [Melastoma candidum]